MIKIEDFLADYTREIIKADPMRRKELLTEWSAKLEALVAVGSGESESI